MWIVSVIAALIIICYVWAKWADKHRAYWGFFVPVKMSALEAECALVHLLGNPERREIDDRGDVVLTYLRGDREVTEARTVPRTCGRHGCRRSLWRQWDGSSTSRSSDSTPMCQRGSR